MGTAQPHFCLWLGGPGGSWRMEREAWLTSHKAHCLPPPRRPTADMGNADTAVSSAPGPAGPRPLHSSVCQRWSLVSPSGVPPARTPPQQSPFQPRACGGRMVPLSSYQAGGHQARASQD